MIKSETLNKSFDNSNENKTSNLRCRITNNYSDSKKKRRGGSFNITSKRDKLI